MRNFAEIDADNENVYVNSVVKSHFGGKMLSLLLAVAFLFLLFILISGLKEKDGYTLLIPIAIVGFIFFYYAGRLFFWNFFGREHLILNTKCIYRHFSYGVYSTKEEILKFKSLSLTIDDIGLYNKQNYGKMQFWDVNENNLPVLLLETSVALPIQQLEEIKSKLFEIFEKEIYNDLFSYNLN